LLDLGAATASQIAPLSKVPRTRIYTTMQQLHQKGLVQILPETPLRYEPVAFDAYLRALGDDLRSRAKQLDAGLDSLAREFAINAQREPESHGRFEAIYGRKNVRERLLRMYAIASREIIGIVATTSRSGRTIRRSGMRCRRCRSASGRWGSPRKSCWKNPGPRSGSPSLALERHPLNEPRQVRPRFAVRSRDGLEGRRIVHVRR